MRTKPTVLALLVCASGALNGLALPTIDTQPADQTNPIGSHATFCVTATGTPPLSYQWRDYTNAQTFADIPGATNACLTLTNIQPTTHRFAVVVSNPSGSVMSRLARLVVQMPPSITEQPANATVELGQTYNNQVVASGTPSPAYQWYFVVDGVTNLLPGKTGSTLSIPNIQTNNAGGYLVTITNLYGSTNSRLVQLKVIDERFAFTRITTGPVVNDPAMHSGGAWVDYDSDGYLDLFVCYGYGSSNDVNRFFHNNRDGTFTRMTAGQAGTIVSDLGDWLFCAWGDYNNDGWMDAYVTAWYGTNILYLNNGNGTFSRVAGTEPRLAELGLTVGSTWGDFDRDGFVDLFVPSSFEAGVRSHLYRNTNGGFVTVPGPLSPGPGFVNGCVWSDYDNDGDLDMIIADSIPDGGQGMLVYRNDHGSFTQVPAGALTFPSSSSGSVGIPSVADYNNDGLPDVCLNRWGAPSLLFHNDGGGQFTQSSVALIADPDFATWADYDNDGNVDLFLGSSSQKQFLHNNGDGSFSELKNIAPVTTEALRGFRILSAWGDYDNDGFLDLFVAHPFRWTDSFLFHNQGNSNHWILAKLEGTVANRAAIGAKVRVKATIRGKACWQLREITRNNFSGDDLRAHFGLGDATNIETLRIEWPLGHVTEMHDVSVNQILNIQEPPGLDCVGRVGGALQLRVVGNIGQRYDLWTSSDVAAPTSNWVHWQTVTNNSRTMPLIDPSTNAPQRFYKATPAK